MRDELFTVKVLFAPTCARYVGEKIWHESQQTKKLSDGSLEMTLRVAGLDEIKHWIMGFGSEAYVVEPEKLKDMVRADLKKALVQYEELRPVSREPEVQESKADYVR